MERTLVSILIVAGSVVWAAVAVRRLRGKPAVTAAGVPEEVAPWVTLLAAVWAGQALLAQLAPPSDAVLTLTTIKNAVALSGSVAFVLAIVHSLSTKTKQENSLRSIAAVGTGLVVFVASTALVLMVQIAITALLGPDSSPHRLLEFIRSNKDVTSVMWVGASAIVTAPLLEELVYRVILQGSLRQRIGETPSIVAVAVLFCVVHGWPDMLGLFPLAICLGYLYSRTNSYLAVVTTHAAFNLCMLLLTSLSQ